MDDLQRALSQVPHGLRDLKKIHAAVAKVAEKKVLADVPVYKGQHSLSKKPNKPGAGWAGAGHLKSTVQAKASRDRATIKVGDAKTTYFIVQEFGGTSYWHEGGAGAYRKLNRGHKAFERTSRSTFRMGKVSGRGHRIYSKARQSRGYFIWNVAYRMRTPISRCWTSGIGNLIQQTGLEVNMASNYDLGIKEQSWGGSMAA